MKCLCSVNHWFESFVNSEECKTKDLNIASTVSFESFVNSEECKTMSNCLLSMIPFESFVNSEECKTSELAISV